MRLLIKTLLISVITLLTLAIAASVLVVYSPNTALSLSQYISPYRISAKKMDINLRIPSINTEDLQVMTTTDTTILNMENFAFSTSWSALMANSQEWAGSAKNGVIHLDKLSQNNEAPSEMSAPNIGNLHNMLQRANIAVENILVNINDTSSATLNYLRRPEVLQDGEQGVEFSLSYQQEAITLPLEGTLLSRINEGIPEITLNVPAIDLRAIMAASDKKVTQDAKTDSLSPAKNTLLTHKEASIDWSPLSQFTPLNLILQSEKIQLAQGEINKVRSRISLTNQESIQGIQQEHTANINLKINNDFAINQPITLRAEWNILDEQTEGADIDGKTVLSLDDNDISITGKMNINGAIEQDLTLTTTIKQFPAKALSKKAGQQQQEIERLLPFIGSTRLNLQKGRMALETLKINAKDSDFTGKLLIDFNQKTMSVNSVVFDINSTQLFIPQIETTPNTHTETTNTTNLDWLTKLKAEGNINIGQVIYNNESVLTSARAEVNLQSKKLSLKNVAITTKDSDINGNIAIGFNDNIKDLRTLTFDIHSKNLIIPQLSTDKSSEKVAPTNTAPEKAMPIEWLSKINADGNVDMGTITYNNETLITGLRTKISLQKNLLQLNAIEITAKDSDLSGKIMVDLNEKTTHLYAMTFDLNSTQITIPNTPIKNNTVTEPKPVSKNSNLFSDNTLPTSWLNTVKAEGNISIAKIIRDNGILMTNADSHLTLDKDILKLNSQIDSIAGGKSDINMSIDNTDNKLSVSLNASANDIILEKLALLPKEELSGGKTDVMVAINSYGNSTKALTSHLQGDILFIASDGVIANNTFEAIGSDLLLKLVNTINPFYKEAKTTELECAVIKSKIADGKMLFDNSIAIKTSRMIIIADGDIDLSSEKINLGINPKARAGVGIDVSSLAKFIAVQGTLSQPSIGVSGTGTAKSLLSIGAAISTGGLSLLATKLADTVISGDACEEAKNAFSQKETSGPSSANANTQ